MKDNNGYLYACYSNTGKPNRFFSKEFLVSYASLKKALPNCKVALYTNIDFKNNYGIDYVIYDKDIVKRNISKAYGLLRSPFSKTILLDTDTIIHRPIINSVFDILDEFSFAATYARADFLIFPDLSSGFIGVKKNNFTKEKIKEWISSYNIDHGKKLDKGGMGDQKKFKKIFLKNKKEFFILPPHFHYRSGHFGHACEYAVLSHDHSMDKNTITNKIIEILKS